MRTFVSIIVALQLVGTLAAMLASARVRFSAGLNGGYARCVLLVSYVALIKRWLSGGAGWSAVAEDSVVRLVVGGALSVGVLVAAFRHVDTLPAAIEQDARLPIDAWLPLAVLDSALAVAALMTRYFNAPL